MALWIAVGFVACGTTAPEAAAPSVVPSAGADRGPDVAQPFAGRIIAVGDLHGDLDSARKVFQMAGVIGADGHWSAGTAVLVQTGDTTDRGPDSKEVMELLARLELEASKAGGRVVALLGNHEAMNVVGDWRYVHPDDVAHFGSLEARKAAFSASGEAGQWLRKKDVVAKVGDTVFVHGGISPKWATVGIDAINAQARNALEHDHGSSVLGSEGPLWLRDYLQAPESIACPVLADALEGLGASRMVVGHTTQRSGVVAQRCDGAILGIDTGISAHYGGNLAAIRIDAGDAWALYPTGPVDLPDPTAP